MKITKFLIPTFLILFTINSFSQSANNNLPSTKTPPEFKYEASLSRGAIGYDFIIGALTSFYVGLFDIAISTPDIENVDFKFRGTYSLEFRKYMDEKVSVGGSLSYSNAKTIVTYFQDNNYVYKPSTFDLKFVNILGTIRYNYLNSEWVDLYGGLSAGARIVTYNYDFNYIDNNTGVNNIITPSSTKIGLGIQLDPIGIRVGKKLSGNLAFGFGNLRLLKFGMSYRFN